MKTNPEPAICVRVDPSNPGQFFACCGLLELADRLWDGAEGWFERSEFSLHRPNGEGGVGLKVLLREIAKASLVPLDSDDEMASPVRLDSPFSLRIDWWKDEDTGGDQFKVWAGSMRGVRIARAMKATLDKPQLHQSDLFDHGSVVYDPEEQNKKVEPFYFDARRGANALALDIGFMPDSLSMTTVAYPAVEFLCLVGLQRFRPRPTDTKRVFDYFTWNVPLTPSVASLAAAGQLPFVGGQGYRFQIAFRTDQKKHKAFTPAIPIERSEL
ncbi:MAG: type I-U CRISPR-associated protein Cas8c [Nitrospira sp.]|nr:type I-U CRISPR-associated protein Cas8c [Nitrospira sp.]MCP9475621.1 type I-U CRISPR-associated protein Cas8c [Nitrospira sp.]